MKPVRETYWAVVIGKSPHYQPYFLERQHEPIPMLWESEAIARMFTKGYHERRVVKVEVRELPPTRRHNQRKGEGL